MPVTTALSPSNSEQHPDPEGRFRELFEQAPISIQILRPDGRTVRANKAWEALWQIHEGSALHALVFSADYNVIHDPQLIENGIAPLLAQALAGHAVELPAIRYDVANLGSEGPARWVTARAHPIKDAEGKVLEVMLMHEDITERVEAENALRSREERFRSLVMATSQTIWTAAPDGRIIDDSPSWRAYTGQTYDEWKDDGWAEALHPDDREPTKALWQACVAAGAVFETRYRLRCASGEYRWVGVKGVPIMGRDGVIREWMGANTDIHELVMAQLEQAQRLERERRNTALLTKVAHASRTLHAALSSRQIADALVVVVRDILEVHQAVVSLTEAGSWTQVIDAVSLSDKYAAWRSYNVKPDGSGIYSEVCRTNQPMRMTGAQLAAHPAWKRFGSEADKHPPMRGWLAVPLIDRNGKNIGLIQVSDKFEGDFTDEDEAILVQLASIASNGFENAHLYGSLQEQDRRKDEFLAMLAHELRNPLAPISTAAEMLKLLAGGDLRLQRTSEVIGRQVHHLTSLVDDLLDVSRVTRGLIDLKRVEVNLSDVVASAIEQARPLIDARQHAFTAQDGTAGARVAGDFNRLVQVIVNLLNNAVKYTPPGGAIVLSVAQQASDIIISVRDNGIGIDTRLLPHVFDLFAQAERTPDRSQGGLGIGLALVKTIVTLHGGTVSVASDGLGAGSVFSVTLKAIGTPVAAQELRAQ